MSAEQQVIFEKIKEMIAILIGAETMAIVGVEPESEFVRDLDMNSIQIVSFAEQINKAYGAHVDFMAWLSGKSLRRLSRLKVRDVVELIAESGNV
jgi:acyl carrier protein